METSQVLKAVLWDLIVSNEKPPDTIQSSDETILNFARTVAEKTRQLEEYQVLVNNVDADEICCKPLSGMDVMCHQLFRYTQSSRERLQRTFVFLTFVADLYPKIEDEDLRKTMIESCLELTATRLNPDDWTEIINADRNIDFTKMLSFMIRLTLATAAVWVILKIFKMM